MPQESPVHAPQCEISTGRLRGVRREGVDAFLGIPYGAAPIATSRWRAPQPVAPWTGLRDAIAPGSRALQLANAFDMPPSLRELYPESVQPMSEDCLMLNVWTPRTGDGARRPVMVWLHGGAFISGVGLMPWTEGARLAAAEDVVVVSLNHRLGLLGFLSLSGLDDGDEAAGGLAGMFDIVAALRWVCANIETFGGDPDCVTLFGQSGGGAKICALMGMPVARGLFHRVVLQSGPALRFMMPEDAERTTREVLDILQLGSDGHHRLREVPVDALLMAQRELTGRQRGMPFAMRRRIGFNPVVDGRHLAAHPEDLVRPGQAPNVPMLIGTNEHEMSIFLKFAPWAAPDVPAPAVQDAAPRVLGLPEGESRRVLRAYMQAMPGSSPQDCLIAAATDQSMRMDSLRLAELHRGRGNPAYVYLFRWPTPVLEGCLGSPHSVDVPFVFRRTDACPLLGARPDAALADLMAATWAHFARTGAPAHPKLPTWPVYDANERPTMCLSAQPELHCDPLGDQRRAWI